MKAAARADQAAFPDMRVDSEDTVVECDKIVVRARWRGTNTGSLQGREPTGRTVKFSGIVVWELDGIGRIGRRWAQVATGDRRCASSTARPGGLTVERRPARVPRRHGRRDALT